MNSGEDIRVIPCGVALIRRGREFLIAQREEKDSFGSFWEFPGGGKGEGETFEECVRREIREEIGIDIAVEKKYMEIRRVYSQKVIWLNFFLCSHLRGEPRPLECQRIAWADVDELKHYKFPSANQRVIARLAKDYS